MDAYYPPVGLACLLRVGQPVSMSIRTIMHHTDRSLDQLNLVGDGARGLKSRNNLANTVAFHLKFISSTFFPDPTHKTPRQSLLKVCRGGAGGGELCRYCELPQTTHLAEHRAYKFVYERTCCGLPEGNYHRSEASA